MYLLNREGSVTSLNADHLIKITAKRIEDRLRTSVVCLQSNETEEVELL